MKNLLLVGFLLVVSGTGYFSYHAAHPASEPTLPSEPITLSDLPPDFHNTYDDEFRSLPQNFKKHLAAESLLMEFSTDEGLRKRLLMAAKYKDSLSGSEFQALVDHSEYQSNKVQVQSILGIQ